MEEKSHYWSIERNYIIKETEPDRIESIMCNKCFDIPLSPKICNVHKWVFCAECCTMTENGHECPLCSQHPHLLENPSQAIWDCLNSLYAKCKYYPLGCLEKLQYCEVFKHQNNCKYLLSSYSLEQTPPHYAGWLKKDSPSMFVKWQQRYFILEDRILMYYKHEKDKKAVGKIDFNLVNTHLELNEDIILMKFEGNEREFKMKADTEDEGRVWLSKLYQHIEHSMGKSKKLSMAEHNFWKIKKEEAKQIQIEQSVSNRDKYYCHKMIIPDILKQG